MDAGAVDIYLYYVVHEFVMPVMSYLRLALDLYGHHLTLAEAA